VFGSPGGRNDHHLGAMTRHSAEGVVTTLSYSSYRANQAA
jgi:hypothetical protein